MGTGIINPQSHPLFNNLVFPVQGQGSRPVAVRAALSDFPDRENGQAKERQYGPQYRQGPSRLIPADNIGLWT